MSQRTIRLAPVELPTNIKREVQKLQIIFDHTAQHIKDLEKSGELLNKNKLISIEARKEGNDLFNKKVHDSRTHSNILVQYSKSILFAPKGTEELILGYSNRSILLMHLHRYKESLVDIDRALKLTKDDVFKQKLVARKTKCLKLIDEENLSGSAKNLTLRDNKDLENLASKLMNFKPSKTLPCASDSVEPAYNDTFGRHLIATRDVNPGEILIVEKSYMCFPMLPPYCYHCLKIAWNGIPCDDCVFTLYCSETCKNEAMEEYHDIECPIFKYLDCTIFNTEKNTCDRMVAIRSLIKALKKEGYENVMKEIFKDGNKVNLDALLSDGILQSDKFKSYYNLSHHTEGFRAENINYELHTTRIVYFLIMYTDFLALVGKNTTGDIVLNPYLLLKLKEALTKLNCIVNANYSFHTTFWQCGCNNFQGGHQKCNLDRGGTLVSCCSLVNHSCTPNVNHSFAPKGKIIVFSISPIKKGEMLCDNYGVTVLESDLKVRQEKLRFTCQCKACLDKIDKLMDLLSKTKNSNKALVEFKRYFPKAMKNSFFVDSYEDWKVSEKGLQYVIKLSQLYYKHFNYYEAFVYNHYCKSYIEKMMSVLYEEKSAIPNNC